MSRLPDYRLRYLLEILDTLAKTLERQVKRIEQQTNADSETLNLILRELKVIAADLQPPSPPTTTLSRFSAVQFTGDLTTMADNTLVLNVGQTSTASPITYLADGITPSGATYSAATYTFSDPSATVSLNSDGITALVTGVAASTGPVSGSVSFTAVDTDGATSQWTQAFTIQTNGAIPPAQLSQSSALTFTTPA